jgi:hypothetical protein
MTFYRGVAILLKHLNFGTGISRTTSSSLLLPLLVLFSPAILLIPRTGETTASAFLLVPTGKDSARHHQLVHAPTSPPPTTWTSFSLLYSGASGDYDQGGDTDNDLLSTLPDDDIPINPLIRAGVQVKFVDVDVGNALIAAGRAWSTDWSVVTESLEEASTILLLLSSSTLSSSSSSSSSDTLLAATTKSSSSSTNSVITPAPSLLPELWRAIAVELKDISTIEGCSSVGPPSSIPNWMTIHDLLEKKLVLLQQQQQQQGLTSAKENNNDHDTSNICFILERMKMAINDLIESI